jgi:MinD-like ATPase involved in chromosome partitioning or flagellar assembly
VGGVISFHSSRGGTGKTVIAVNLAVYLANEGVNVALIDLDFRAPSLFHVFKEIVEEPDYWVNDYLDSCCNPDDFLFDVQIPSLKGSLLVGFANPSIRAIQDMVGKSRASEAKALKKLFELKRFLFKNLRVNLCFYDNCPGIQYSSLNAIVSSDQIVFVSTSDPLETEHVKNILKEYNDILKDKTYIILNKVFPERDHWSNEKQKEYINQLPESLRNLVIGAIPCYYDVLKTEKRLLILEEPTHPLVQGLHEIIQELVHEYPPK